MNNAIHQKNMAVIYQTIEIHTMLQKAKIKQEACEFMEYVSARVEFEIRSMNNICHLRNQKHFARAAR